jgi:hypothetical protein
LRRSISLSAEEQLLLETIRNLQRDGVLREFLPENRPQPCRIINEAMTFCNGGPPDVFCRAALGR